MPNIFGNNNVAPPGVPIPPGPMGPQGPQGPPGPAAIQEEGVSLPARGFLNFVGSGVTAADDAANNRVTVTVTGGGGGATPGGPDTSIQVHNAGVLTGYSNLTYDGATLMGQQMQFACTDPTVGNDPNYRRAWDLRVYSDSLNCAAQYSGTSCVGIDHIITGGYYNSDSTTAIKSSNLGIGINLIAKGASQAFGMNITVTKNAMGDCGAVGGTVKYRGGPLSGDEGQCYQCFAYLSQDSAIVTHPIASVRRSACPANMVVTQAVTASKDQQTVTVSGTAGLAVNDWLVAGQSSDTGPQHIRAIQVISFTGTTITTVIAVNMAPGDSLKAALVLGFTDTGGMGQLIPLVNLSGAAYVAGTVSSITTNVATNVGEFNGTGTAWAANMVGGDALNIGAVSLVNDNDSVNPFDATPPESGGHMLRSWYQIMYVTGAAKLGINSYSCVGARAYRGNGAGAGGYLIKPAARALWFPDNLTVVCEYSPHTWNVGDLVESTICPYPDGMLQYWSMSAYTPGGTYRGGIYIINGGHRTIDAGFILNAAMGTGHDAPWGWASGVQLDGCKIGISLGEPLQASFRISCSNPTTHNSNIQWSGGYAGQIGLCGNQFETGGFNIQDQAGHLNTCTGIFLGELSGELRWGGSLSLLSPNGSDATYLQLGADSGPSAGPGRLRIMSSWRLEYKPGGGSQSFDFHYINDGSSQDSRPFSIGPSGPALPSLGAATASVNFGSTFLGMNTSLWDGSTAQSQTNFIRADISSDGYNMLSLYTPRPFAGSVYANRCFAVTSLGKLIFGNRAGPFIGEGCSVTFDPSGIPDGNHPVITIPNASGTMALLQGVGPGELTRSVPAALNATVDIGTYGAVYSFRLQFFIYQSGGAFVTKTYDVTGVYLEDSGGWQLVRPTSEKSFTGLSVDNFELEVSRTADGFAMRIRHTIATDTSSGNLQITLQGYGNPTYYTFTPSTATGTSSVTTYFASGAVAAVEKIGTFTAGPNFAGQLNYIPGGAGVKDIVQVCAKAADNSWAWRTIY